MTTCKCNGWTRSARTSEKCFLLVNLGRIICPFVETLSFGSDFRIRCNESYVLIDEINVSRKMLRHGFELMGGTRMKG